MPFAIPGVPQRLSVEHPDGAVVGGPENRSRPMPPTIIIGYDGSDHAQDALALGDRLAGVTNASVILTSVLHDDPLVGADEYERVLRTDLMEALGMARDRMQHGDVRLEVVAAPSAAHGLHQLAERTPADLIVVGSSHRGALGRILAGSVAERLLHGSPCAVAVAPAGYAPGCDLATIGVAYDASSESRTALNEAVALAELLGAEVRLVGVADPEAIPVPRGTAVGYSAAAVTDDLRRHLQDELDSALADLPDDITADAVLVQGDAAAWLGGQHVDLLFCGSRGYGLSGQVLLGSVSTRLIRGAHCPVVVVPRGAARSLLTPAGVQQRATEPA